ncbi:hypothetical protein [Confluentibacter flavum]|uniref:Uncharacterized protein n=1 Tax=Confluentibacter flavum TaxID=1909700 RepID=A0A2N3HHH0_9FLAO|nr:hypothetical protein [Confluentibacter flavum]PKQ44409.1 hypothetical protein CSW08_13440 [Confluentibacter flavum]
MIKIDYKKESILNEDSVFGLIQKKSFKTIELYQKFINWVSGEFDLYLQEESMGLKVYYPNGWFAFEKKNKHTSNFSVEILVKGKSRIDCQKILFQLDLIYNHVACFQN